MLEHNESSSHNNPQDVKLDTDRDYTSKGGLDLAVHIKMELKRTSFDN